MTTLSQEQTVARIAEALRSPSGHLHLVGIGGVGMAGLALLLAKRGFTLSGCDLAENSLTSWLRAQGVGVVTGHAPDHLGPDVRAIVRSAAVNLSEPEIQAARSRGIPVWLRGETLAALTRFHRTVAVSGTHGKTTTSAMIAHLLRAAGLGPGYAIGGEVECLGGVAAAGKGEVLVVEADESDGTFALYEPRIAVITNIEYDHMEHFADERAFLACFERFAERAGDLLVWCADDPHASRLMAGRPSATGYGLAGEAEFRAENIEFRPYSSTCAVLRAGHQLGLLGVPMPGLHNVRNALAAATVATHLGLPFERIREGLGSFTPPRRRFQVISEHRNILVISDYAHHPTEIAALMTSAQGLNRARIIAVFQPHRFTRTLALGPLFPPAFMGATHVILTPVYAASEKPLAGGSTHDLLKHFQAAGPSPVEEVGSLEAAWQKVRDMVRPGDLLLIVGAGDVETIAWRAREAFSEEKSSCQF